MKKLSLNLEQLEVESFHVQGDLRGGRGTVRGRIEGEAEPIPGAEESVNVCAVTFEFCSETCQPNCTLGCTLAAGCSTLCNITKAYTCPRSCGYIICIRFD